MPEPLEVRVYDGQQLVFTAECPGPVELGRQRDAAERPYNTRTTGTVTRIVIARADEATIPREVIVEALADGSVRLHNRSTAASVAIGGGDALPPCAAREFRPPLRLVFGRKEVHVSVTESPVLHMLAEVTAPPGRSPSSAPLPSLALGARVDATALVGWLQALLEVFQSAAATDEFFTCAERAAVDTVGLDSGRVLLLDESGVWRAHAPRPHDPPPSRHVLEQVLKEKRTFWAEPRFQAAESLKNVRVVVAAPILDPAGRVIGVLYGDRRTAGRPVSEVEARLVELLASGVATGLARLKQERATLEARVRFEQFFTPELARSLAECPGMLDGRDVEVTVLFADVRGYSAVSEKLGPAGTVEWIRDVLGALSACVLDEGGVLVDYIGDELMAMWGVPAEQPDHAARACRAALAMRAQVPVLNERWQPRVGATQGVGIGVHTGMARVGNVGTPQKFKYSALGHTVNLASRVQGATKYLRRPLLITGATRAHLSDDFPARRLTKVRVVNIRAAVDLYELVSGPPPGWAELRDGYEAALTAFEANNLESAARMLAGMLDAYRDDGPSLLLLSRAVNALLPGSPAFDPVWELPGK